MTRTRRATTLGLLALLLTACARQPPAARAVPARAAASSATSPGPAAGAPVSRPVGARPQTDASPTADAQFTREMAALWRGVQTGNPALADPAFFPEAAYLQLKAISHPRTDYATRLLGQFHLDLLAAHALLGANPAAAQFLGVALPAAAAGWVPPGGCYNRLGYWHLAGARVRYRLGATVHSFAIALLISWRGQWYVVHLGAVVEPAGQGTVDDPLAGPGVAGVPPGPC